MRLLEVMEAGSYATLRLHAPDCVQYRGATAGPMIMDRSVALRFRDAFLKEHKVLTFKGLAHCCAWSSTGQTVGQVLYARTPQSQQQHTQYVIRLAVVPCSAG